MFYRNHWGLGTARQEPAVPHEGCEDHEGELSEVILDVAQIGIRTLHLDRLVRNGGDQEQKNRFQEAQNYLFNENGLSDPALSGVIGMGAESHSTLEELAFGIQIIADQASVI